MYECLFPQPFQHNVFAMLFKFLPSLIGFLKWDVRVILISISLEIPWSEEPGRLQSMGSQSRTRLSDFLFTFHFHALQKEMATHSSVIAWRIPRTGVSGGLPSIGLHRVGHD
ncbi:hypothetical protein JEQ12_001329 [Ovis aries]|uniref:Uncharacterized protein n=1 Tax=Ovis aries TaxID=9940 RepID=A0A836D7V1_SHEEP|nr:hypothetical protein JEQ12_001329 [Ovis aries]